MGINIWQMKSRESFSWTRQVLGELPAGHAMTARTRLVRLTGMPGGKSSANAQRLVDFAERADDAVTLAKSMPARQGCERMLACLSQW